MYQSHYQNDHSDHEKQMNKTSGNVADQSKQPAAGARLEQSHQDAGVYLIATVPRLQSYFSPSPREEPVLAGSELTRTAPLDDR